VTTNVRVPPLVVNVQVVSEPLSALLSRPGLAETISTPFRTIVCGTSTPAAVPVSVFVTNNGLKELAGPNEKSALNVVVPVVQLPPVIVINLAEAVDAAPNATTTPATSAARTASFRISPSFSVDWPDRLIGHPDCQQARRREREPTANEVRLRLARGDSRALAHARAAHTG